MNFFDFFKTSKTLMFPPLDIYDLRQMNQETFALNMKQFYGEIRPKQKGTRLSPEERLFLASPIRLHKIYHIIINFLDLFDKGVVSNNKINLPRVFKEILFKTSTSSYYDLIGSVQNLKPELRNSYTPEPGELPTGKEKYDKAQRYKNDIEVSFGKASITEVDFLHYWACLSLMNITRKAYKTQDEQEKKDLKVFFLNLSRKNDHTQGVSESAGHIENEIDTICNFINTEFTNEIILLFLKYHLGKKMPTLLKDEAELLGGLSYYFEKKKGFVGTYYELHFARAKM